MDTKKWLYLLICFTFSIPFLAAQPARKIKGTIIDKSSRQPIEYVNVLIIGLGIGNVTDEKGEFTIDQVPPGIYKLQASAIGYKSEVTPEYILSTKDLHISIEMEENSTELAGVTVTPSPFRHESSTPIGLHIIGLQEIEKSPGANRDISRIVQSYPGVSFSPAGYRNDLIVRGGSPSDNRFYLDGVEIPNINHFSTQGASGGPVGIINADLIREVNFYSGAFPADKGNALSSVLDFKLRDGDMEHNSLKATLGASEVSLASNGHLGKKTSYLVSARQSYLQLLFSALGLPFLPTFTDAQFKIKTRFDAKNELTVLGLGGIDNMRLNKKADGESNEYILGYLPKIQQETFTLGTVYRHYAGANVQSVTVSHSYLNDRNTKYKQNDESSADNLILRLRSIEQNTQLRLMNSSSFGNWKIQAGASFDYSQYSNTTFQKIYTSSARTYNYHTNLGIWRTGIFSTATYATANDHFTASLGLRTDASNYSSSMNNILDQLSPRASLSYKLTDHWTLSGNAGIYYQLPPYTALGFKDNQGVYINKENLRYMKVNQEGLGLSWHNNSTLELSAEAFYRDYDKIPLSVTDNIPLACKGNDYGVVGNELLTSTAEGRSYGIEFMAKWIIAKKLTLGSSLTIYKSEYRNDSESPYIASVWDNRYIFNLRGTYNLKHQWSIGTKISSIGGTPYTPYDEQKSSLVTAWDAQGKAYFDYSRYNMNRLSSFAQIDIRVDKTFYIGRCMLGCYLDIQNLTASKLKRQDVFMSTGVIQNPKAPLEEQHYIMKRVSQSSGTVLPTIGLTFEY